MNNDMSNVTAAQGIPFLLETDGQSSRHPATRMSYQSSDIITSRLNFVALQIFSARTRYEPGCLFIGDPPAPAPHERLRTSQERDIAEDAV